MKKILAMSFPATSGMTLFSYILSVRHKEKFLEPLLLNQLIYPDSKKRKAHHASGYFIHLAVGLGFTAMYKWLWKKTPLKPDFITSLTLGFVNGMAGIAGWHSIFMLHRDPPHVKIKKYYLQLLAAHVIFGWINGMLYKAGRHKPSSASKLIKILPQF